MVKETAFIALECRPMPFGAMEYGGRWVGPAGAPVRVDRSVIRWLTGKQPQEFPNTLDFQGLSLRLVSGSDKQLFVYNAALYMRVDGARVLAWRWHTTLARIRRPLRWVYLRLILTLHVWSLAEVSPGEVISWRCVRRQKKNCALQTRTTSTLRSTKSTSTASS